MKIYYKSMNEDLIQKLKHMEEVDMENMIKVSNFGIQELIEEYFTSIIFRILNIDNFKMTWVVVALQKIWKQHAMFAEKGVKNMV